MEDLESAISGVMNNPEMMKTILGMAQSLGAAPSAGPSPGSEEPPSPAGGLDPARLGALTGLLRSADIDADQQALLSALTPYMSGSRIAKLKKAMQAAHLAELASSMLGNAQGR